MSVTTVQVTNFPVQISQDEFGKLFSRLDGFLGCRIVRTGNSEPVGYIDFANASAAGNAASIYDGWRGWSPAGLIMKTMQPLPSGGQPLKRSREGPDVMYGDPRLKQPRPSNLQGFAPSNGGYGSPAPQQQSLGFNRLPNMDPVGTIPGIGTPGMSAMQQQQQQTPVQQRPPQLVQGNVSSLAFGMDTVQPSAAAPRPSRPLATNNPQAYPNPNYIPVAGSTVTPQQPTPQQQQQERAAREAVRAAIIQQQGGNPGPPQGFGSPAHQGQAMSAPRAGPQGLVPAAFADLLPVASSGPPAFGAQGNQYHMGPPNNGLGPAGMQPAPQMGGNIGPGPGQQLPQQLPQQQLPPSGQLLGQPGQHSYQPHGHLLGQPAAQMPPAQDQPVYQDSYSAGTPNRQDSFFQPATDTPTQRRVEVVEPEVDDEVLPPEANPTLFISGLPLDISKREVAHILRPFEGYKELRLVQKVDRSNKDVMWCFAEFSSAQLAARTMKILQGYAVDMDNPESPTLRISYARALNNPKVREARPSAEEPRASTPLEVRVDRPQPYSDPRSARSDPRGPPDQYGPGQPYSESDLIPVDPRKNMRGRPQPRDATPNRRAGPSPHGGAEYGHGPPGGQRGGPSERNPGYERGGGYSRGNGGPGFSKVAPRDRDGGYKPPGGGRGPGNRQSRGPQNRR